jgi:hypothetical protein
LKEIGYSVRDKKADGDYYAHISYKAPEHGRATREDKLGEEYTREALTEKIKARLQTETIFDERVVGQEIKINERVAHREAETIFDERGGKNKFAENKTEISVASGDETAKAAADIRGRYKGIVEVTLKKNIYLGFAVIDVFVKDRELKKSSRAEKEQRRVAYLKNCIFEDVALINHIERGGAVILENEQFSDAIKRLMREKNNYINENGDLFSDSLKRFISAINETDVTREDINRRGGKTDRSER